MKLPKPNKYGTVRVSSFVKLIESGLIEGKCDYHMTNDYAWDNANNFGKHDGWLLVKVLTWKQINDNRGEYDHEQGKIGLHRGICGLPSGGVRLNENGTYSFRVHSNLVYTMRVKQ